MKFISYLIIAIVSSVIGYSYLSTIDLISKNEVVLYKPTIDLENHYLLEPLVNLIAADMAS